MESHRKHQRRILSRIIGSGEWLGVRKGHLTSVYPRRAKAVGENTNWVGTML